MGDVEPRRSARKRTASTRLQDMQLLGVSAKQITKKPKRLADQSEHSQTNAHGKRVKTEKEPLAAQSSVTASSGRRKKGKDATTINRVPADVDREPVDKLQTDTSIGITNVELQHRRDRASGSSLDSFRKIRRGEKDLSIASGHQSNEDGHGIVKEETTEHEEEQIRSEKEEPGKGTKQLEEETPQAELHLQKIEQELEQGEEGRKQADEEEHVDEATVQEEEDYQLAEQEEETKNTSPEKGTTMTCDTTTGAVEETADAHMKTPTGELSHDECRENIKVCALVESCEILSQRTDEYHNANDAIPPIDDTSDVRDKSATECPRSEQDGGHIDTHGAADDNHDDLVGTATSTVELGQLQSVYDEANTEQNVTVLSNDTNVLLGLDSTTQLICDVAARLPSTQTLRLTGPSQADVTGTVMTFGNDATYVLKTNAEKSDARYESTTGGSVGCSDGGSDQPVSGSGEDTTFFMNETAPLPCDSMVVSTSGDTANQSPVCVMHLPSVTTDTSQAAGTPCNVIADVVQVSGTIESSNVTYVNVSSTTNPLRVGDLGAGVGVGSIDTVGGTHVDVVLVPAIACTDGLFRCDYCKYTTDKKANWYKHKIHHTGRRPYSCDKCPYNATTSSNLRRHQLIHAEVRSFQCTICDVKFRQKIHLERHIKYKHQEKSVECPHCDYHCANVTPDLKIHLQRKHQIGVDQPQPPLRCSDCSFTTVSRKDLKQHEKFHKSGPELKLYCEECCFVTDCQSRLKRHLLTHTHERPFSCALCNYRATQKEHIARHMKAKHEAEASDGYPHRRMNSSSGNHTGQVAMATGLSQPKRRTPLTDFCNKEKLFACNFCTMSFAKLINLYKHIRVQHGNTESDGLHACVVCEYRSTSRNNLLVHMRKHNANVSSDPPTQCKLYSCVVCKFMHPKRQTLYSHMRKVHNMQIVVTKGNIHCLIDANDIPNDDDTQLPAMTVSSTDAEQVLISVDASNAALLQMASGSRTDTAPPGGSFGSSEAINAVQKLQVLSQTEETVPLDGVVLAEDITVSTDQEEGAVIGQDIATATDIEVCSSELSHLSSGDYVEINGEMYKVEFSNQK